MKTSNPGNEYIKDYLDRYGPPTPRQVRSLSAFWIIVFIAVFVGLFHVAAVPEPSQAQDDAFFAHVTKKDAVTEKQLYENFPVDPRYVQKELEQ